MSEQARKNKRVEGPVVLAGIIAAGLWWFLISEPSTVGWIIAALLFFYVCAGYCYFSLALPADDEPTRDGDMIVRHKHSPEIQELDKLVSKLL